MLGTSPRNGFALVTLLHSVTAGSSPWEAWLMANVAADFRRQQLEPFMGALPEIGALKAPFSWTPLHIYNKNYEANKYTTEVLETWSRRNC